jgi:glyoxylase-like metal-dependent hydrolase (beta-lactamase superfamily II)
MSESMTPEKIDGNTYCIDQMWMGNPKFSSTYLVAGEKAALVDPGPSTVVEHVLGAAASLGYRAEDIGYLICTHVHVDHAGGAGTLCRRYPHLTVLAHERGVEHLADPRKLYDSMKRVFGEAADTWYGEVLPVPRDRLRPLSDGEVIDLGGGRSLRAVHTAGHAVHHLSLYDESSRSLFAGEALGVYFPEVGIYFPSTPPPEFDLEGAVKSVERIERLPMDSILYAHFGRSREAAGAVKKAKEMLIGWGRVIHRAMQERDDTAYILGKLTEESLSSIEKLKEDPGLYNKYKLLVEYRAQYTCGPGYIRYFKKGGKPL